MGFTKADAGNLPDPSVLSDDPAVKIDVPSLHDEPTLVGLSESGHEVVAHPSGDVTVHPPGYAQAKGLPVDPKGKGWIDTRLAHTDIPKITRAPVTDQLAATGGGSVSISDKPEVAVEAKPPVLDAPGFTKHVLPVTGTAPVKAQLKDTGGGSASTSDAPVVTAPAPSTPSGSRNYADQLKDLLVGAGKQSLAKGPALTSTEDQVTGEHPYLATALSTLATPAAVSYEVAKGLYDKVAGTPQAPVSKAADADPKIVSALQAKLDGEAKTAAIQPVLAPGAGPQKPSTGGGEGWGMSSKTASRPGVSAPGANDSEYAALKKQNDANATEAIAAKQAIGDAQNSAATAKADAQTQAAEGSKAFDETTKANLADYQTQAAATTQKYMKVADELVNSKIDRHKLFKDVAERGNTMQLVIGSLLYGAGAGGLGQDPDIISKLVDQNVKDQETDLANHAKGGEMYNTHLGRLSDMFKDKEAANFALRNAYWERAKTMVDATATRAGIPLNNANVLDANATIHQGQTKNAMEMMTHVLNTQQQRASIHGTNLDNAIKGQTFESNQYAINFRNAHPGYVPGQIIKNIYNKDYVVPLTAGNAEQQGKVAEEVGRVYQAHQSINDAIDQGIKVLQNDKSMSKSDYTKAGKALLGNILSAIENVRQVQGVNTVATSELFNATKHSLENGLGNDSTEIVKNWEDLRKRADVAADSITTYHGMPALSTARAEYMAAKSSPTAKHGRK